MPIGEMQLPKMDGVEISPGIFLIGEPIPIEGSSKLRCLANVGGALCLVELAIKFPRKARAPVGEGPLAPKETS